MLKKQQNSKMGQREQRIRQYIKAYNSFDVEGMLKDLDENVHFENIAGGEVNLSIRGISAFKEQAEKAKAFFTSRKQTITAFKHEANQTEIEIDYHAVLAIDFSDSLKKGDELNMKGKSVFNFSDSKITSITDIS